MYERKSLRTDTRRVEVYLGMEGQGEKEYQREDLRFLVTG